MNLLGTHRSKSAPAPVTTSRDGATDAAVSLRHTPIAPDARSCCCPGGPVAQVIMAPRGTDSPEVDILLCAHHLRRSAPALRALGAAVYDRQGELVDDVTAVFVHDR